MNTNEIFENIISKRNTLLKVAISLKQEFIGLDDIIDEIITLLTPWYLFPQTHVRPTVINLWGLTGTGKTALVKRLVELLEFNKSFVHMDMGSYTGDKGSWIKSLFTDDLEHFHEKQNIICLDEFQFARSLDESNHELSRDNLRVIWELLDSGKIYYEPACLNYYAKRAEYAIHLIDKCAKKGLALNNGLVTGDESVFLSIFSGFYFDQYDRYNEQVSTSYFLSKDFSEGLIELFSAKKYSKDETTAIVKTLSFGELALWLLEGIQEQLKVKQLDVSKGLIFILGNLDEAFYMSSEMSPDMSADDFYLESLKINIADIKHALRRRFRNEQIARLGNNHLVYPCFNNAGYRTFIERHIERLAFFAKDHFALNIQFYSSVVDAVYNEGVFPTQGMRPVLTTLRQMVEPYIGHVVCFIIEQKLDIAKINWSFENEKHKLVLLEKGGKQHETSFAPKLRLSELRKSENSDLQMHTAVHESGHAIVAALTLRIIPAMVATKTVSSTADGFCKVNFPERLITKEVIRKEIMIALAGYLAEKLIFGEENTSTGVSNDIERASESANRAIKEYAMGHNPIRIQVESTDNNDVFFTREKYIDEAMALINSCKVETEQILIRNKLLLLKLSLYLTEHSVIREKALGEMIRYYGVEPWLKNEDFVTKDNYYKFKDLLHKQLLEIEKDVKDVGTRVKAQQRQFLE
jgi:cell division protease FtsH